ncbi:MAG: hemolysin family protein [Proteobacteria bacterium]|nr:hemolysin family protein [Pseudomonadota bacterium]
MDLPPATLVLPILILLNAFFVTAEIAIIASSKARLSLIAKSGDKSASIALQFANTPESFLSTVQVGITLMNILIGIYSGATLGDDIQDIADKILPHAKNYSATISSIIVLIITTFLTVLGEVLPKRIAMLYPEEIAMFVARAIVFWNIVFFPIVKLVSVITSIIMKIIMKYSKGAANITNSDLKSIVYQAERLQLLSKGDMGILRRIMHLNTIQVGAIMTPRSNVISIDINNTIEYNQEIARKKLEDYFILIKGNFSEIIGIVSAKNLLAAKNNESLLHLKNKNSTLYIPEMACISNLIEAFKKKKVNSAIVVDEYGDIEGIVTINDVIEVLTGITGDSDINALLDVIQNADNSYLVSGTLLIDELKSLLAIEFLPDEDKEDYRTLASFLLKHMKNFPKPGEKFILESWEFQITKMKKHRILEVLIKKQNNKNLQNKTT